jgi:hypothetical protein
VPGDHTAAAIRRPGADRTAFAVTTLGRGRLSTVRRRSVRRSGPVGDELAKAWSGRVDGPPADLGEASADLVETAIDEHGDVAAALTRFGRVSGSRGWPLAEVSTWVDALAQVLPTREDRLHGFAAGHALAAGWADGFLRGCDDVVIDPLTGLTTTAGFRLRMSEVSARSLSLGVGPDRAFAVLVVDTGIDALPMLVREAARVLLADAASAVFSQGETVCETGGRVLVLASRTTDLERAAERLVARLRRLSLLAGAGVQAWVEPLPARPDRLDAYLLDLAGVAAAA